MEDKIEVNEYVRTDYGEIHKVVHVVEDDGDWNYYRYENTMGDFQMSITKHSKQLIDLIECGDIVETFDVLNEEVSYVWNEEMLGAIKEDIANGIKIKRILTHEQFEANCYKVGGEDE